jgi:alpha-1,2-mannosyltransferase
VIEGSSFPRSSVRRFSIVVLLLALLAAAAAPRVIREMPDFEVYYRAGTRARQAEPLYRATDGHFQHKYLPVFAVAAAPLTLLPLNAAKVVWFFVTVAALALLVAMSIVLLPDRRAGPWALAGLTTLAMLKFYLHELNLGQCNSLLALFVVAAAGSFRRARPARAGGWLAVSAVVKPYTLVFLPYLVLTRRWRALAACAAVVIAALLLPAAIYGVRGNFVELRDWIRTITETTAPNLLNQDNVSVWAMYAKWFGIGRLAAFLAIGTIAGLLGVVAAVAREGEGLTRPEYLEIATLMLLVPILSPQGWDYGLLAATPAVALVFDRYRELPRAVRIAAGAAIAVTAFSVFDVMGRRAYAAFMASSAITVCALVVFGTLAVMRARRLA